MDTNNFNSENNNISQRIKELIDILKISQAEFSRKTGIDPGNLSRILTNKVTVGPITTNKIILSFNVCRQWLERGEGEIFLSSSEKKIRDSEDTDYITIPKTILYIMEKQAASLETRDRQINRLIEIIDKKTGSNTQQEADAQQENNAGCVDASGF